MVFKHFKNNRKLYVKAPRNYTEDLRQVKKNGCTSLTSFDPAISVRLWTFPHGCKRGYPYIIPSAWI